MHVTAYVALGANLGDPVATVCAAIDALRIMPATRLISTSPLYRTAPVGLHHQPDFINAVAALEIDATILPAPSFLKQLFAIEAGFGRVRNIRNAPRTLDLDLLLYGDQCLDTPELILPHPRMTERAFVLVPLFEIAPALEIPGQGGIAALMPAIADQRVERLT